MKSLKKIAAVVATLALTVGMTANCFAASWQSYFGVNEAWFEGAEGKYGLYRPGSRNQHT